MLKSEELELIEAYLKNKDSVDLSYPFSDSLAVFSVDKVQFAYLETSMPIYRLSLRSDPQLIDLLIEKYDEVLPGYKLNPKQWLTIVISGQLSVDEIKALVDHSYQIAQTLSQTMS